MVKIFCDSLADLSHTCSAHNNEQSHRDGQNSRETKQQAHKWYIAAARGQYDARVPATLVFLVASFRGREPWRLPVAAATMLLGAISTLVVKFIHTVLWVSFHRNTGSGPAGREVHTGAGCMSSSGHVWRRAFDGSGKLLVPFTEEETANMRPD